MASDIELPPPDYESFEDTDSESTVEHASPVRENRSEPKNDIKVRISQPGENDIIARVVSTKTAKSRKIDFSTPRDHKNTHNSSKNHAVLHSKSALPTYLTKTDPANPMILDDGYFNWLKIDKCDPVIKNFLLGQRAEFSPENKNTTITGNRSACRWKMEKDLLYDVEINMMNSQKSWFGALKRGNSFLLKLVENRVEKDGINDGGNECKKERKIHFSVLRKYKHFKWLENVLKQIYPYIFLVDLNQDTLKEIKIWLDYITSHPVLRNSGYVKSFLTIVDHDEFKSFCEDSRAKNFEEIALAEVWKIQVSDSSKVLHDIKISMDEMKKKYDNRGEIYASVSENLIKFAKVGSRSAENQNSTIYDMQKNLQKYSLELESIESYKNNTKNESESDVSEINSISKPFSSASEKHKTNTNQTSKLARLLSEKLETCVEINASRTHFSEQFIETQKSYSECIKKWDKQSSTSISLVSELYSSVAEGAVTMNDGVKIELGDELHSRCLRDTKIRTQQVVAIHEAEHNFQLERNNSRFCTGMKEFVTEYLKNLKTELEVFEELAGEFE